MFESDGWLEWEPDPERAARDASHAPESFAALSRAQLLEALANAKGGREWEFYQELFLSRCAPEELAVGVEDFMKAHLSAFEFEELCFVEESIRLALERRARLAAPGASAGEKNGGQAARLDKVEVDPPGPLASPVSESLPPMVPILGKSS